jgi:hypothetical protein
VPSDLTNGDNFGYSVAFQGTRAVIGAVSKDSNNITGLGAAYVFTQTNVFIGTNVLSATNAFAQTNLPGATNALFETNLIADTNVFSPPSPVALTNAVVSTNALVDTNLVPETNAIVQTNSGWIEQQELLPLQTSDNFEFGFSVAIGTQGILVGAPAAPIGRGTGAAYMFGSSEAILSIVAATATPSMLTPPNHMMVPVSIHLITTGSNVVCKIIAITSNQADVGTGRNADAPDAVITGDLNAMLRAELPDNVNFDRVYNILVECRDTFGNIATTTVQVVVPHTLGAASTTSSFNATPVFNNGSVINVGTINTGVITPGSINSGAANPASPFTQNLATP